MFKERQQNWAFKICSFMTYFSRSKNMLLSIIVCLLSTSALADFEFNLSALLSTEGLAQDVAIGDVSGDGVNDIVVINNGFSGGDLTNHVLIYLGADGGGITAPQSFQYSDSPSGMRGLVLMNVDDDDEREVFIGHGRQLTLINLNQLGEFTLTSSTTSYRNDVLDSIDLDLDGQPELVSVQSIGRFNSAVFYDVAAVLPILEIDLSALGSNFEIESNDVTGDGLDDFLVINKGSSLFPDLSVYEHDGIDGFLPVTSYSTGDNNEIVSDLASGDFNDDGLNDVFLTQNADANSWLYLQDNLGALFQSDAINLSVTAKQVSAADLNVDGLTDAVMLHNGSDGMSAAVGYILQDSLGLQSEQLFTLPAPFLYELQAVALGDVDQDGCMDAAIADYNVGLIILLGEACNRIADLSIDVLGRGNQMLITGSHLAGEDVNKAIVSVIIETPFPVNFIVDGCRTNSAVGGVFKATCFIGNMSAGEMMDFTFRVDVTQLLGVVKNLTITANITSELEDLNPSNNTQIIRLR